MKAGSKTVSTVLPKTVETVKNGCDSHQSPFTQLKLGVNEKPATALFELFYFEEFGTLFEP